MNALLHAHLNLDALARLDFDSLHELYLAGSCPTVQALDGSPRCRMLAIQRLDRRISGGLLRRFSGSSRFPWAGKTFAAEGETGRGINRIRLLGNREWYAFTTREEPSVLDGKPCVLLDYDHPENPWFIRRIRDELREVSPGLYLGPALLRAGGQHTCILFFSVDKQ